MLFYLDSSNRQRIADACELMRAFEFDGLDGVTTNPSLAKQSGLVNGSYKNLVLDIANSFGKAYANFRHVSAQAIGNSEYNPDEVSAALLEEEARRIYKWNRELDFDTGGRQVIVPKIPGIPEGLKAVRRLAPDMDVNVTLVFNPEQARLAALAGAAYVSPFIGRIDDLKEAGHYHRAGADLLAEIVRAYREMIPRPGTRILTASTRSPEHIMSAYLTGCHIATFREELFFLLAKQYPCHFRLLRETDNRMIPGARAVMLEGVPKDAPIEEWPGFDSERFHSPKTHEGLTLAQKGNADFMKSAREVSYTVEI